jgi:hypothetical protein
MWTSHHSNMTSTIFILQTSGHVGMTVEAVSKQLLCSVKEHSKKYVKKHSPNHFRCVKNDNISPQFPTSQGYGVPMDGNL